MAVDFRGSHFADWSDGSRFADDQITGDGDMPRWINKHVPENMVGRFVHKNVHQVLLSYGTYTNLELLEHYGFLLDTNPNEKAFIPLEPEIYSSCSWPKDSLFIHQKGIPSFSLLSALRLWLTLPNQRRSVGHLIYSGSQLSLGNERIVMRWILKKCRAVLENLPTSIEEDKSLIITIDKMQELCILNHLESMVSSFEGEARSFLEIKVVLNGDIKGLLELSRLVVA